MSQKFVELILGPEVTGILPVKRGTEDAGPTEGGVDVERNGA